jgi:hypothetical protein
VDEAIFKEWLATATVEIHFHERLREKSGVSRTGVRIIGLSRKTLVLGAYNVPVALPSVQKDLVEAFEKVQAGQVQPKPAGVGKVIYQVGDISRCNPANTPATCNTKALQRDLSAFLKQCIS